MADVDVNIVIPLYNEEEVFHSLEERLTQVMDQTELRVSVIMIDDGSRDATPKLMEDLAKRDARYSAVFLSRNFGHQLALSAGLSVVDAEEAVFVIDGDLQDPPELLDEFYSYYRKGYDVVYAVRSERKESWLKKGLYNIYYKLLKRLSYLDIPLDSGDFSLISRRVVDEIVAMKEESRFLRGMRTWVGYKQIGVTYARDARHSGDSKYSFKKLFELAMNGIYNFSETPIKFISLLGFSTIAISLLYLGYTLVKYIFFDAVPEGFTGLIFAITLFGGVQLLSIGILGEYILRIFFQVKERPLFIIKRHLRDGKEVL